MKYIVTINNKNYEVEVEKGKATLLSTTPATQSVAAPAVATAPAAAPAPAPNPAQVAQPANVASSSANVIKAPMPGTILDIKVSAGQAVKTGDVLIILEAMKMENEIMAPKDGVVSAIHTSKGASVGTGDALLSLD